MTDQKDEPVREDEFIYIKGAKENNLKNIRFRYRGDNPANWLLEKKHL